MTAISRRTLLTAMGAAILAVPMRAQQEAATAAAISDEEMEQFLRQAKIVRVKGVSTGTTGTKRATLSDGRLTHDASVQTIDVYQARFQGASGAELNFRDSYKYNIAAYRLDRMLDLRMIPVSVSRKVAGDSAAVTWWVDDVLMMEKDRFLKKIDAPDTQAWNDQMHQARVFNELVYNTDANLGNLLITKTWKLWMIDFSRAFRLQTELREPENLAHCRLDRRVYRNLRALDQKSMRDKMGDVLRDLEIDGVLARRNKILAHFDQLIAAGGEQAALCDLPGH